MSSGQSKLGEGQQGPRPHVEPCSSIPEDTGIAGSKPGPDWHSCPALRESPAPWARTQLCPRTTRMRQRPVPLNYWVVACLNSARRARA